MVHKLDCLATESAVNTSKSYSNVVQCLCRWYSYFECISLILQVLIERCDTSALYEMPRAVNCHKVMGPELKLLYVFSLVAVLQYIRKIRKKLPVKKISTLQWSKIPHGLTCTLFKTLACSLCLFVCLFVCLCRFIYSMLVSNLLTGLEQVHSPKSPRTLVSRLNNSSYHQLWILQQVRIFLGKQYISVYLTGFLPFLNTLQLTVDLWIQNSVYCIWHRWPVILLQRRTVKVTGIISSPVTRDTLKQGHGIFRESALGSTLWRQKLRLELSR